MKRYFSCCVRASQEVFVFNHWKAALINVCCSLIYITLLFSISEDDSPRTHDGRSFQSLSGTNINCLLTQKGGIFSATVFTVITGKNSLAIASIFENSLWVICHYQMLLWTGHWVREGDSVLCSVTYLVSELRWVVLPLSTSASPAVKQRWWFSCPLRLFTTPPPRQYSLLLLLLLSLFPEASFP